MSKRAISYQLSAISLLLFCGVCYAQPVSSTELINNAKQYDGKPVTYSGEVIGDVMVRGTHAWVNVSDDVNAVGIWMPKNMVKDITYKGSYKEKGDKIEINGIFNRSCKEHGGDLDIHAESMVKLKDGCVVNMPLDKIKIKYAALFGFILILVAIWKGYKKFFSLR